jgi:excisionase family DNA binding protein
MLGPAPLPQLLTMDQLAERLGVTRRHVRRLVDERRVPFLKVGRFIRFNPEQIAAWLDSLRVPARVAADERCQAGVQYSHEETSPAPPLQVEGRADRAEKRGGHQ